MVFGTHKQASTFLIHQQSFITAGPLQPEGSEAVPGLELCKTETLGIRPSHWMLPTPTPQSLPQAHHVVNYPTHTHTFTQM